MPLTDQERARWRVRWRQLATVVEGRDPEQVKGIAGDALQWPSPLDDPADAFVLFGFARLAHSFARSRSEASRRDREPALAALTALTFRLVGENAPAGDAPPRQASLPYRDD